MAKTFDDIEVGDQLEMTADRGGIIYGAGLDYDPNRVIRVAVVTHIWFDPVDNKEYVGLSYLKKDGSFGKPTEKRTITGLARTGWKKSKTDWIEFIRKTTEADKKKVVLFKRPSK